jgi:sugar phosphate isomerase/epimerase
MKIDEFGMDTIALAGPLQSKLRAIRDAGFGQVMLSARDLVGHPEGLQAALAIVRASGLQVTGFQALRDFEGLSGTLHAYKVDIAKSMIEMCAALGCKVLLACSSTSQQAATDTESLVRDLRKLAMLAIPHGIRVAYEALPSGTTVNHYTRAWELICAADCSNLGLGLNSSQILATDESLDDLDLLDPLRIFLVQLSDFMWQEPPVLEARLATARTFRVFPGEGVHSEDLARLVMALDRLGYRGAYSFDVLNDDYQQLPATVVAQRARRSAVWLAVDVLQRMVPLPGSLRLRARSGPT